MKFARHAVSMYNDMQFVPGFWYRAGLTLSYPKWMQ